ncbi:MAG: AI-2E family transporter [Miniphocaeibacter sp.]|uniref:AI-2E family transporter n=1 Tax=Miniphocaeibacter sp. TaxID=3100973 RepID=UPI0017D46FB1|nr:AI-2E family transporter [Gallicola sp.]
MKIDWNEKDRTKAIYGIIVAVVSIIFFFVLYRIDDVKESIGNFFGIFYPFIIGGVFAFLLNLPLSFIEKMLNRIKVFSKLKDRTKRIISTTLTYILFLLFIVLFFSLLIPQLYDSIKTLIDSAGKLMATTNLYKLEEILEKFKIDPNIVEFITDKANEILSFITDFFKGMLPRLGSMASGVVTTTVAWFVGFIASIYILFDKERFGALARKVSYSFLPTKVSENLIRIVMKINSTMKGYIGGQLLVVSILGIMMAVGLSVLGVEGAIAMGFIIAVTDLIPYIGPWIGSVPVFLMISVQNFNKALIFIVMILIAQQIEENLLKPRVQSDKLGISAFWILVSIIIGGSLFGIVGMIVGVPIFVVIYQLIKEISEYRLKKKGLPIATDEYLKEENKIISGKTKKNESGKILDIDNNE